MLKKEYVIQRDGKKFVLYKGLLNEAHQSGLTSIETKLVQIPSDANGNVAIASATVTMIQDGVEKRFTGIGDASSQNVAQMLSRSIIRMAETRAKSRALRDATNIAETSVEELDSSEDSQGSPQRQAAPRPKSIPQGDRLPPVQDEQPREVAEDVVTPEPPSKPLAKDRLNQRRHYALRKEYGIEFPPTPTPEIGKEIERHWVYCTLLGMPESGELKLLKEASWSIANTPLIVFGRVAKDAGLVLTDHNAIVDLANKIKGDKFDERVHHITGITADRWFAMTKYIQRALDAKGT